MTHFSNSEKTVLPADAVYAPRETMRPSVAGTMAGAAGGTNTGGPGGRYSPGALQVRRAAVVLQPPTTV